ncbi:MAG: ketoacyl-ACP synthase III [Candidatus Aminicenantes bacterium]|nr:ketoacyl-ACP synthase III [Candidatus Aminicenantes bacterium]
MTISNAKISAVEMYVPEKILTNKELEKMVDTTNEWILERTGIRTRHICEKGQAASDLAAEAVIKLCKKRGISPKDIELIIVPTVTPDMLFPSTACLLQEKIGADNAWGFDLSGACSGFLFALSVAEKYIQTGIYRRVVVVGSEIMSSIADYTNRETCVLFGDAAGAVLLEPAEEGEKGIIDILLRCDGSGGKYLYMPGGGSLHPATHETVDKKMHYIHQQGRRVFKFAVTEMANISREIMKKNNITSDQVKLYVPHQANMRIIKACQANLGFTDDQIIINIQKYGNTTSATIPLCLYEASQEGRIKKGDYLVLASFGAGFTWGSILLQWEIENS